MAYGSKGWPLRTQWAVKECCKCVHIWKYEVCQGVELFEANKGTCRDLGFGFSADFTSRNLLLVPSVPSESAGIAD